MNQTMQFQTVQYELKDQVAHITLNRPHRLNAVVPLLVEELNVAIHKAEVDQAKVILLSGKGKAFSSGHDLKDEDNYKPLPESISRYRYEQIQNITRKIRKTPIPVIALVRGYALGAGCEIALCCDLIVAEENTKFGFPEVQAGLSVTGGISNLLPQTIGLVKAKELLFLGEMFTAQEAKELGLINFVVDEGSIDEFTKKIINRLKALPYVSLSRAKIVLNEGSQTSIEGAFQIELEHVLATTSSESAKSFSEKFSTKK